MEAGSNSYPMVQLFTALEADGIKFILAGMSAATFQSVLAATVDVDRSTPTHQTRNVSPAV